MNGMNVMFVDLALYILLYKMWQVSEKYLYNKKELSFGNYFAIFCIVVCLNFLIYP